MTVEGERFKKIANDLRKKDYQSYGKTAAIYEAIALGYELLAMLIDKKE